jgi:hypothetical protein
MNLLKKSDTELLSELKTLADREREIHLQVLHYLREVERRDLHLARGFSSLFAFCTEFLGFTEKESMTRIQAMRLVRRMPSAEKLIEGGVLSVSVAARALNAFQKEEKRLGEKLPPELQLKVVDSLKGKSVREAEKEIATVFPEIPIPEKVVQIAKDRLRIEFIVSEQLYEKLQKLKQLLAHREPLSRYDGLIEYLADRELEKLLPKNNALSPSTSQATKKGRYIPASTKRKIWENFHLGCAFTDAQTGRRCGSKQALEIDHIQEFAKGGSNKAENLQLLCPAHNKFKSRATTGQFRKH